MFTVTGRMTMQEPSIQMVPRDFNVNISASIFENVKENMLPKDNKLSHDSLMSSFTELLTNIEEKQSTEDKPYSLSLRRAFVASKGCLLIAADYSQIELRILAHLSKDKKLTQLLKKGAGDVFKSIAASWLSKPISQITIEERQRSKQICYGILYGMGPKALAEQLDGQDILEEQAVEFMASFKSAYPDVQTYIEDIICNCRKQGYAETLTGRRRYLPDINIPGYNASGEFGGNEYARAAAERQAVNTTVQGSAADLIKLAMININRALRKEFPSVQEPITSKNTTINCGAYLVLQLHDELIYEVAADDIIQVAQIIRMEMENAIKLIVPTPVKMKIGPSWGELTTMKENL